MTDELEERVIPADLPEESEQTELEDNQEIENPEEDTSQTITDNEDEFADLSEEELREKARQLKTTAENYKREIESKGLRKKERVIEPVKTDKDMPAVKTDFLSKKQDVLDTLKPDFNGLEDSEWGKIKNLITPTLDSVYQTALKENRFVARGELERTLKDLVNFAKSEKSRNKELEEARLRGIREKENFEDAEIGGTGTPRKTLDTYSDEVKKVAKAKGWSLERTKEILEAKAKRAKEYAPTNRF